MYVPNFTSTVKQKFLCLFFGDNDFRLGIVFEAKEEG